VADGTVIKIDDIQLHARRGGTVIRGGAVRKGTPQGSQVKQVLDTIHILEGCT